MGFVWFLCSSSFRRRKEEEENQNILALKISIFYTLILETNLEPSPGIRATKCLWLLSILLYTLSSDIVPSCGECVWEMTKERIHMRYWSAAAATTVVVVAWWWW